MTKVRDTAASHDGAMVTAITFPDSLREKAEAFLRNGGSLDEAIKRFVLQV